VVLAAVGLALITTALLLFAQLRVKPIPVVGAVEALEMAQLLAMLLLQAVQVS
jgi:hypothetical protein